MMTAGARQTGWPANGVGHGGGTTHGVGQPIGTAPFAVNGQTVGYGDGIGHPTIWGCGPQMLGDAPEHGGGTMQGDGVGDGDGQAAPVAKRHGVMVGVGTGLGGGDQHAFIGG
jgi:hypothetical protein